MRQPPRSITRHRPKASAFRRHRQRGRIGGVCAGLEDYTGWDRNLFRFLFLLSLLFGGLGLWIYLLLWIAVPSAQETPIPNISMAGRRFLKGLRREIHQTQKIHEPWLGNLVNTIFDSIKLLMPEMEHQTTRRPLLDQAQTQFKEFDVLIRRINQLPADDFRQLEADALAQRIVDQLQDIQQVLEDASLNLLDDAFLSSLSTEEKNPHPTFLAWRKQIDPLKRTLQARHLSEAEPFLTRIEESLRFLFSRLDGYQNDLLDTRPHDIERIAFHYLPDTLKEYLKLPESLARSASIRQGGTAEMHLLEQLTLLDQTLHDFSRSLFLEDAKGLLIHGRFLREKFKDERVVEMNVESPPR